MILWPTLLHSTLWIIVHCAVMVLISSTSLAVLLVLRTDAHLRVLMECQIGNGADYVFVFTVDAGLTVVGSII